MSSQINSLQPDGQDPTYFLGRSLSWLRWIIITASLLITILWPVQGRLGHSVWQLILVFTGYNLLIELLRQAMPQLRSFAYVPILDLLVVGLLYFLDYEPGGPTFVFFYLASITAAATMNLRGTIFYTIAVVITVVIIAPTLPGWSINSEDIRQLSSRLVVLALVGTGTSILARRLALEHTQARAMRDEAERLTELDRLRNGFISTVSHELRTPLTAARGALGMLETSIDKQLRSDERKLLGNAQRNIERLRMFIDDLLTYNQFEAGTLHLDCVPLDLSSVIGDAVKVMHPMIKEKGQTLKVDLSEPLVINRGDPRRLGQVFINLLNYVYAHIPSGSHIWISGRQKPDEVVVTVSDNGSGIPDEDLETIFQPFHRLDQVEDGSELGLAIAKAVIELHGGQLSVESVPGPGVTFSIALPRNANEQAEQHTP
jgi:signal transduction histidine kinase